MIPALLLALTPAAAGELTYTLNPAVSQLYVQVFRDESAMGSDLAHDHVVLATGWTGSVTLDPASPAGCRVQVEVPVAGLQPDSEAMRQTVGYAIQLTEAQRAQVREHMLASDQLDAGAYPAITFRSTDCQGDAEALTVTGDLSIHGVSRPVVLAVSIQASPTEIAIKGGLSAAQTDFGFAPYTAFFGALRNQDPLRFTINVVGSAGVQ